MADNTMFAFQDANAAKTRCVVQEDNLDDSTKCTACGMAEMLGYLCDECEAMHCGRCLPYEAHRCKPWAAKRDKEYELSRQSEPTNVPRFRLCSLAACREKTPVSIACRFCGMNFCSRHKLESDHACAKAPRPAAAAPKPAAPAKAASNPFAALFLPASLLKTQPEPAAVRVPDLHIDDRYPITIMFPHVYRHDGPQRAVVHKKWGLGKTVDFLLKSFGNKTGAARHVLVRAADLTKLPTMASFQELSAGGKLKKTDLLLLLPETWYTKAIAQFNEKRMEVSNKENLWKQFYTALPDLVRPTS